MSVATFFDERAYLPEDAIHNNRGTEINQRRRTNHCSIGMTADDAMALMKAADKDKAVTIEAQAKLIKAYEEKIKLL